MDDALSADALRGEQIFNITKQLRLACCAVASRSCSYLGVYSADQVPTLEKLCSFRSTTKRKRSTSAGPSVATVQPTCCYRAKSFIANTDPAAKPGYHWVAFVVFRDRPSVIYYFDSFGMPLSNYEDLYRTCLRHGYFSSTMVVNSVNARALQGGHSTVCGHYCVLYLYMCARVSLGSLDSRTVSQQGGFAFAAMRVLVQATGGNAAKNRDAAVVHILNELRTRKESLTPALACSRLGSVGAAGRSQCCQARK